MSIIPPKNYRAKKRRVSRRAILALLVSSGLLSSVSAGRCAEAVPAAEHPFVAVPKTVIVPRVDGHLHAAEWADAAKIGGFVGHNQAGIFSMPTELWLKWDDDSIYVGFRSKRTGRPLIANSEQGGPVWLDDGMELMFSPGDARKGVYHIIGNTAGKWYDEIDSDKTWESEATYATSIAPDSWSAEWRLPLAKLTAHSGKLQPGALWRFMASDNRTSESGSTWELRSEWVNPGPIWNLPEAWGWLKFTDAAAPTAAIDELAVSAGPEVSLSGQALNGALRGEIRIFRNDKLEETKTIDFPAGGRTAGFKWTPQTRGLADLTADIVDGKGNLVWRQVVKNQNFSGKLRVELLPDAFQRKLLVRSQPVPECPAARIKVDLKAKNGAALGSFELDKKKAPGVWEVDADADLFNIAGSVIARVEAFDAAGQSVAVEEAVTATWPLPEWAAKPVGLETNVPLPWTPLTTRKEHGNSTVVRCWNREYHFRNDGDGLLEQVTSGGKALLNRPVRLRVLSSGREIKWKNASTPVWKRDGNVVTLQRRLRGEGLNATLKLELYYDGYLQISTVFDSERAVNLDRAWLDIPLKREGLKLFQYGAGNLKEAGSLPDSGLRVAANRLWVGSQAAGLGIQRFSEPGVVLPAIQALTGEAGSLLMTCDLLPGPRRLTAPFAAQAGLAATPVKPWQMQDDLPQSYQPIVYSEADDPKRLDLLAASGVKVLVFHEHWSPFESSGVPYDAAQLKKLVREVHKRDMKLLLYIGSQVADQWPEFEFYRRPWVGTGKLDGWARPGLPGRGLSMAYTIDYQTAPSWTDYISWTVADLMKEYDIDGIFKDGGFAGNRPLAERVYRAIKSVKPDGLLCTHDGSFSAATGGFLTDTFGGEGLAEVFRTYNLETIPADFLQALEGRNFGSPVGGWPINYIVQGVMNWEKAAASYFSAGVYTYGTEMPSLQFLAPLWKQGDLYRSGKRAYYTDADTPIKLKGGAGNVRFTSWAKEGRIMVALGSLGKDSQDIALTAPGAGSWRDLRSEGDPVIGSEATLNLNCKPGALQLLLFEAKDSADNAKGQ